MKFLKPLLFIFLFASVFTANAQRKQKINADKSQIKWIGKKLYTSHTGTITFKSGEVYFSGKTPIGGNFTVEMNTINTTDLKGKSKEKLDAHLKSEDFFDVKNFPEAKLNFTSVESTEIQGTYYVTADLTIKGITNPVSFDLQLNKVGAIATVKIDRILYDVKHASTLTGSIADKAISDEFELNVALVY